MITTANIKQFHTLVTKQSVVSAKRDLPHVFQDFNFFSSYFRSLKCPSTHCFLHTENRSICHGVVSSEFLISHTFQRRSYISIARTENFIMYARALGPFSRKRSHMESVPNLYRSARCPKHRVPQHRALEA